MTYGFCPVCGMLHGTKPGQCPETKGPVAESPFAVVQIKLPGREWEDYSGREKRADAERFLARPVQGLNVRPGIEFRVRGAA